MASFAQPVAGFAHPIQCGSRTDVVRSRDTDVARARRVASRDIAREVLARSADRLLADARNACLREGVAATRRELLARVARRVGLSQAEVARRLAGDIQRDDAMPVLAAGGVRENHDPIMLLAATILGARERAVFLARRDARRDDVAALHRLAACLGLSVERIYELEASARRKLAVAVG